MPVNINTASLEELKQIPGVGDKIAQLILQFREIYGVVKKEALVMALRGNITPDTLDMIDFSVPTKPDPFDIDLGLLPSAPNTSAWEPLLSFSQQQKTSRQLSPLRTQGPQQRSRSPESHKVKLYYDTSRSRSRSKSPVTKKSDKKQSAAEMKSNTEQRLSRSDNLESGRSRSPAPKKPSHKHSVIKSDYSTPRRRSSSRETKDDLLDYYEKMSSPFERTLAMLKADSPKKGDLGSSRTSHTSPVCKKEGGRASELPRRIIDSRQTVTLRKGENQTIYRSNTTDITTLEGSSLNCCKFGGRRKRTLEE